MKALHIIKYGRFPVLENLPIPDIGDSDLLIKMKYAPINPSDIFFYQGKYSIIKSGYSIVGFEGSGIIEKAKN
jgi:NADPH:quinone reductase-like Zn-dependent oxidoreductase